LRGEIVIDPETAIVYSSACDKLGHPAIWLTLRTGDRVHACALCSLGWAHAESDIGPGAGDRFIALVRATAELPEDDE
jgi:hypothetical protein